MNNMSTVAFHTLGCKVNHYETEAIWQLFKEADYDRVDFETNADVFVINTCTVTNTGDKKVDKLLEEQSVKILRPLYVLQVVMLKHHLQKLWKFQV